MLRKGLRGCLKAVNYRRSMTVKDACRIFKLSRDTIRRDFIRSFSSMGLVMRSHGGIALKKNAIYEYSSNADNEIFQHKNRKKCHNSGFHRLRKVAALVGPMAATWPAEIELVRWLAE